MRQPVAMIGLVWASFSAGLLADDAGMTSLANPAVRYSGVGGHYVVLRRGDVEAVVVDNEAVDDQVLPGHKAGYSGVGALRHVRRNENLFVSAYAGLNFEHVHDGTPQPREILFEPRGAPMQLRRINEHEVELYQPPTPFWGLESCHRYSLLEDGCLELTIEAIPRKNRFHHGYMGLFWASYIDQPESLDIHFPGQSEEGVVPSGGFVAGVTPAHGVLATHRAVDDRRDFRHDASFPLSLVFNHSRSRYRQPWYYGLSHGMAYVQMFRPRDQVRLTQSPSGGGPGCPAWDFQFLVSHPQVDRLYRFQMRACYLPFESADQIASETLRRRTEWEKQ